MSKQLKYCIRVVMVAFLVITVGIVYLPRSTAQVTVAQASTMQASNASTSANVMNGHAVAADFLAYWNTHGGLAINGYPISDESMEISATDGKSYATQWFERARYERHPENAAANRILLGLLGAEFVQGRSFASASSTASNAQVSYFPPTNHSLSDSPAPFKSYWQQNGGLAQFGYPLSEQVKEVSTDGNTYTVQYFERQRFEFHPEQSNASYRVLLGLLGAQIHSGTGDHSHCRIDGATAPLPEPTGTAEATHEPRPTCTPEPTRTPEPTNTPNCEHNCQPTPEPTGTNEVEPSVTPEPTHQCEHDCQTPEPTETHHPEPTRTEGCEHDCQTPQPTETHHPEPTRTPEPSHTPGCGHDCQTPQPTETHHPEPTQTPGCEHNCQTPQPTETHHPEPTQTPGCEHNCQTPQPTETHHPEPTHTPEPTQTPGCEHQCEPTPTPQP